VLLIEDDPIDAARFVESLAKEISPSFHVDCVASLHAALQQLDEQGADIALVDLRLPDSHGLSTFEELRTWRPELPMVIVTASDDDAMSLEAVRKGAQDYLVKGQMDSKMLSRVMRYALERQHLQEALRSLSLLDELTGLYNRRGFMRLAEQQLKLAHRTKRGSLLLLADLDGLKGINDTFGHAEGDAALVQIAEVIKGTFRTSDVMARIGGDEFAIIAIEAHRDSRDIVTDRLQQNLADANAQSKGRTPLSLSVGAIFFGPESGLSVKELLAQADAALYEEKRKRRKMA
jgi:diguanylate cyclase (GGDEF)-like protein